MDAPIYKGIKQYLSAGRTSFHMPGHKGQEVLKPSDFFALDVSELPDTDDLHAPHAYIAQSEQQLARLYHTRQSFYLLGGSSCGIHAMLAATLHEGDTVILDRECHKSVIHALIWIGAKPVYIYRKRNHQFDFPGGIHPADVQAALEGNPQAKAVLITSPTYYGGVSDIASIAKATHENGAVLLVDEAHGAHFPFGTQLPESAISCGADMVVQSVHKTLGALSGSALLHICSDAVNPAQVRKLLAMFQTSSPSYTMLCALEQAVFAAPKLEKQYTALLKQIETGRKTVNETGKAYWIGEELNHSCNLYAFDATRIVINFAKTGLSGYHIAALLREKHKIEVEMADEHNIVCITTPYNDLADIKKLTKAVLSIVKKVQPNANSGTNNTEPPPATVKVIPREAFYREEETIHLEHAAGRISKYLVCKYPPGTPILAPGEEIGLEHIRAIADLLDSGATVNGIGEDYQIAVVRDAGR